MFKFIYHCKLLDIITYMHNIYLGIEVKDYIRYVNKKRVFEVVVMNLLLWEILK